MGPKRGFPQELGTTLRRIGDLAAALVRRLSEALRASGETALRVALRPAGTAALAALAAVAPYVSRALWLLVAAPVALVARVLDLYLAAVRLLREWWARAAPEITPARVVAAVAAVVAVTLIVSQFMDYRGIAIGKPGYEGRVGTVAPAPQRDLETAGSAHLYLLVPVGLAALALIGMALRGDWRLGRAVAGLGALGILVSVLIDLPKGLDEGTASTAYYGAEAQLTAGFWIQILSCGVLVLCGLLLSAHLRDRRSRSAPDRRPATDRPSRLRLSRRTRLEAGP